MRGRAGSFCHQIQMEDVRRRNRTTARGLHPCVHFTRHHFSGISHELDLLLGPGDADSLCPPWTLSRVGGLKAGHKRRTVRAISPARKGSESPLPHTVPGSWWQGHKQDLVRGAVSPGVMGPTLTREPGQRLEQWPLPGVPAEGHPRTGRSQGPASPLKCWDSQPISGSGA